MSPFDEAVISPGQDALIRRLVAELVSLERSAPAPTGGKVLLIPRYYQISFTRMTDIFWALALRLRGVEVVPILCNRFHCEECMIYGGNYGENRADHCRRDDLVSRKLWVDLLGFKPLYLTDFGRPEDEVAAAEVRRRITFENHRSVTYRGYRVGFEAAKAVANLNDTSVVEDDERMVSQLKVHAGNAVRMIDAYERVLDEVRPDSVFSNIPFYYSWNTALHAARSRGIPFYGIGVGERDNSSYFVRDSGKIYDFEGGWESFRRRPLAPSREALIDRKIFERSQGRNYALPHYKRSNQETSEHKVLSSWIDKRKKLIFFPVNVPSDATILGETHVFGSLREMIVETIRWITAHPEWQLIIKAHPAEEQFYGSSSPMRKYCLKNILAGLDDGIPPNVFFIDYQSAITSFDIYPLVDLGIMFTSSAAIEMAWIGKPSVTTAEAHYSGKGFTYDPKDETEYHKIVARVLSGPEPDEVVAERISCSRKYFYYYFFHALIKFDLYQGNDYNTIPTKLLFESLASILPGRNPALDYVCGSIIERLPIYGDERWPPFTGDETLPCGTTEKKHPEEIQMQPLLGFDPCGEVFTRDGRVLRGIFRGHGRRVSAVFDRCVENGLFDAGIVKTSICRDESLSGLGYDLVLEHERIPFITYAHEWPPRMFKDAALFQLDLDMRLLSAGLVLKDCGVTSNVLFSDSRPVFVDFLSIVPMEELAAEEWLKPVTLQDLDSPSGMFHEVFRRMFFPGVLFPLYLMHQGKFEQARRRLFETALNTTGDVITEAETFAGAPDALLQGYRRYHELKVRALRENNLLRFLEIQREEVQGLIVTLETSGYADYYDLKGENFPFSPSPEWKAKQWGVYEALQRIKPETVLDIGANTGWFSVLASTCGARVVAAEIDPACADILYGQLRRDRHPVQPVVLDILNATPDVPFDPALADDPHFRNSRFREPVPLMLDSRRRLQSDLVLALAIIHHISLGQGVHLKDAVRLLAEYGKEALVLEFVDRQDPLIQGELEFFKAYCASPDRFGWYDIGECRKQLDRYYGRVEAVALTGTRTLLVCSERTAVQVDDSGDHPAPDPTDRPRVLFTTPLIEHPPASGPSLRIENTIKALNEVCELHVAVRTPPEALGGEAAEDFYRRHCHVFAYTPCLTGSGNPQDELVNAQALVEYANAFDIGTVWCGYGNISYHLMKAIKALDPKLKVVCDTDSVWSRFVLRELPLERDPARRRQIEAEGHAKEREEAEWVDFCDITTAVSDVDGEYYRSLAKDPSRIRQFSNVIDLESYATHPARAVNMRSPSMYLAGSFYSEASPMARAARWVIGEVLPAVLRRIPDVTLYVIGNGADRVLPDVSHPNVVVTGKVPSVLPYLCHADVALVPLMFESGTRFKILEAAACGIPIVSTTLGAEGLPTRHGEELLLADEPAEFADAVVKLIGDKVLGERLARNCKAVVDRHFSVRSLAGEAMSILDHLSRGRGNPVEHITWNGQHIATIVRKDFMPEETVFLSPDSYYQQLGFVVYPSGGVVARHSHLPLQRHLVGTPETLLIRKGRTEVELYAMDKSILGTWVLEEGDMIQLVSGGHRFNCLENTIFLEIKQGPYTGLVEKEQF